MTACPADLEQMRFTMRHRWQKHYDISCCFRINVIQNKPQDTCQTTPSKTSYTKVKQPLAQNIYTFSQNSTGSVQ